MTQTTKKVVSAKSSNAATKVELGNSAEQAGVVMDAPEADASKTSIFDTLADNAPVEKSTDDIIKDLLLDANCKRINGLHVRNVVATAHETYTQVTFVVKEFVFGDVRDNDNLDAFGMPTIKLGRTHNVITSTYAVSAVMKNSGKQAIFAQNVADMTAPLADGQDSAAVTGRANIANTLFAGGTIDVICQYVPAHTDYVNPFASDQTPVQFDNDKIIHHVVRVGFGEVGNDVYKAYLLG